MITTKNNIEIIFTSKCTQMRLAKEGEEARGRRGRERGKRKRERDWRGREGKDK